MTNYSKKLQKRTSKIFPTSSQTAASKKRYKISNKQIKFCVFENMLKNLKFWTRTNWEKTK